MSSLKCSTFNENHPNGFIIQTGDSGFEFLFPRLLKSQKSPQISPEHCLFCFAHDIIYKFQCEDFDVFNFEETRKYLSAYFIVFEMKKNPFLKNRYEKLAINNKEEFITSLYYQLIQDLEKYQSFSSKQLVNEAKKELLKIKEVL